MEVDPECGHANDAGRCYLRPGHYGEHLHSSRPFPSRSDSDPIQGRDYVEEWHRVQVSPNPDVPCRCKGSYGCNSAFGGVCETLRNADVAH